MYETAYVESALDDPEHISLDGFSGEIGEKNRRWMGELNALIASADNGKIITEGIRTVILGKPNAGKSSLLNLLLGEERRIVTDVAEPTRDTLEENVNING